MIGLSRSERQEIETRDEARETARDRMLLRNAMPAVTGGPHGCRPIPNRVYPYATRPLIWEAEN